MNKPGKLTPRTEDSQEGHIQDGETKLKAILRPCLWNEQLSHDGPRRLETNSTDS